MSDTPRTDEALIYGGTCMTRDQLKIGFVGADFARQLERELNEARGALSRIEFDLESICWGEFHIGAASISLRIVKDYFAKLEEVGK